MTEGSELREIEFKFAVRSPADFEKLLAHLGEPASVLDDGVLQVNHFFDTPSLDLHRAGRIVRLREQEGRFGITIKGEMEEETGRDVLTERIEYEAPFDAAAACAAIDAGNIPIALLLEIFREHSSAIRSILTTPGAAETLSYIGNFRNTRVRLPVELDTGSRRRSLLFELDSSRFPNRNHSREIEVEITDSRDAEEIRTALVELLESAGIEWFATSNKARRFFEALRKS